MKKLSLIASGLIVVGVLIGCGGGGSSGTTNNEYIQASDAYVAKVDYITIQCDGEPDENLTSGNDFDVNGFTGEITFKKNICDNPTIIIPDNALVDIDGNGRSNEGQRIRMALKTKGAGTVANPIGTAFIEKGLDIPEEYKYFDPVAAKEDLLKDNNETLKKLVAISDAIAYVAQELGGEINNTVAEDLNLSVLVENNISSDDEINVTSFVKDLLSDLNDTIPTIDVTEITKKAETVINVIDKVKSSGVDSKNGLKQVLFASDVLLVKESVEPESVVSIIEDIQEGNVTFDEVLESFAGGIEIGNIVNVKSISLGGETVEVDSEGKFEVSFDKDTNTSIYKNITLDATCLKEDNQTLTFDFNISNSAGKYVFISIPEVNVSCSGLRDEPNSTIYENTSITIETNVEGVMEAIGCDISSPECTNIAEVTTTLTNTDLKINLDSLKNVLSDTQKEKINRLEEAVNNTYLQQDANYTITINAGNTTIEGLMIIGNGAPIQEIDTNTSAGTDTNTSAGTDTNTSAGTDTNTSAGTDTNTSAGVNIESIVNVTSITLGSKTVQVDSEGNFEVSFNNDTNTSIYKNIELNATCLKEGSEELTFDFNISNSAGKYVFISIPEVNVSCSGLGDEPNSTIYESTSITIETNVEGVMEAIECDISSPECTNIAEVTTTLTNTDLKINLDSLKNVLNENQQGKIEALENAVNNTYLQQDANYTITINAGNTTIEGLMIIGDGVPDNVDSVIDDNNLSDSLVYPPEPPSITPDNQGNNLVYPPTPPVIGGN